MGNTIQIKHGSGSNKPTTNELSLYELGLNTSTNVLHINNNGSIVGFLPLSAGPNAKLTGNLYINKSEPGIYLQTSDTTKGSIVCDVDSDQHDYLRVNGPNSKEPHLTLNANGNVLLVGSGGTIYLRPTNAATYQTTIDSTGNMTIKGNLSVNGEQISGHTYYNDGSTTDQTVPSGGWSEHSVKEFTDLDSSGHFIMIGYTVLQPSTAGNSRLTIQGYSGGTWSNIQHQIFPTPAANANNWGAISFIGSGYSGYRFCVTCAAGVMSQWRFRMIRVC